MYLTIYENTALMQRMETKKKVTANIYHTSAVTSAESHKVK